MANEKKTLLENFLSLGAMQFVGYIIPLISLPYLSRVLGVEKFGLVYFVFAFIAYFSILTDYGFALSATREIAVHRHNRKSLSNIFSSVTVIKLLLLAVSFILLCSVLAFIPKFQQNWLIFLLAFPMVIGNALYPVWFFQGMERMKYITLINIFSQLVFLALIFVFVKQDSDFILVPVLNSVGALVAGILGLYFSLVNLGIKFYIPKWKSIKKQFKYSSEFFLSRVSVSAYTNTNTFCLGLIGSPVMVGYYVAAEKIYNAILGLQEPLAAALYPFIAKNRDFGLYKKIFIFATIANVLICVLTFIFAKQIITLIYGDEMTNAYKVLYIFVLSIFVTLPSRLLGYPLLAAAGHTKEANSSVIIGSVIHITGLIILYILNKMNIYSVALMIFLTECIVVSIRAYYSFKYKLLIKE